MTVQWEKNVYVAEKLGIRIQVNRLPITPARFSFSIGKIGNEGRFMSFLNVTHKGYGRGKIEIERTDMTVCELIRDAEDWCQAQLQIAEDERIEKLQAKEHRELQRDKPKPRPGLKTLAKNDGITRSAKA